MQRVSVSVVAAVSLGLLLPVGALASEENQAKLYCEEKIRSVYGVDRFRDEWVERLGNHKFKVHGKVKYDGQKYPFNCKVKHGNVKSYAYDGPNPRYRDHDDDDDSNVGAALAVGAGLAIIAAIAASQAGDEDKDQDSGKSSGLQVKKSVLEDECHDNLQYRIRDEHNYTAAVQMQSSRVEGLDLVGDAKVKYEGEHPHHATFTCHFDRRGRVMDSRYHLF